MLLNVTQWGNETLTQMNLGQFAIIQTFLKNSYSPMLKFGESLRDIIITIWKKMLAIKVNFLRNITTVWDKPESAKGCKPNSLIQKQYGHDYRVRESPKRKEIVSIVMTLPLDMGGFQLGFGKTENTRKSFYWLVSSYWTAWRGSKLASLNGIKLVSPFVYPDCSLPL